LPKTADLPLEFGSYHNTKDISISGFAAMLIFGGLPASHLLWETYFELAVIENFVFSL